MKNLSKRDEVKWLRMKNNAVDHTEKYGTLVETELIQFSNKVIIPAYYITKRDGKSYHLHEVRKIK